MSTKEKLAARLKERKGLGPKQRNDAPAPDQAATDLPPPGVGRRAGTNRARYSHSQHTLLRLEALARNANRRAAKAEAARDRHQVTARKRIDALKAELHKLRVAE